jgi:hypothetical protein
MNLKLNAQTICGAATLITTLILITPLCGLLFQCGCNWPWLGLDDRCNFYQTAEKHHCPWCASKITGLLSIGLAIIGGVLTTMTVALPLVVNRSLTEVAVRIALGLTIFVLVALLTGGFAAIGQNYPLGVGFVMRLQNFDD